MAASDAPNLFQLKQIRAARVSEISETTAAAPVPAHERVNFHIGNPLQDAQLSSAFLRIALGLTGAPLELDDHDPAALREALDWPAVAQPRLEFLIRTIRASSPYLPRGGFSQKAPHPLVHKFCAWLTDQPEALNYDLGEQSGRREIILASGGVAETLRVVLHALNDYLERTPARILCYRLDLGLPPAAFPHLEIVNLAAAEAGARAEVEAFLAQAPAAPTFLIVGGPLREVTRRALRELSTQAPLFFIEANDAPNHRSLGREAMLMQRVIRLLTPAIFGPGLERLSPVFVIGNADFLRVIENVHFKLKGTPSASEVELLNFLLEARPPQPPPAAPPPPPDEGRQARGESANPAERALGEMSVRLGSRLEAILDAHTQTTTRALNALAAHSERAAVTAAGRDGALVQRALVDPLADRDAAALLDELLDHAADPAWGQTLERAFLSVFLRHQPQYQPQACLVASGSSRTALGLLGFHCGITEVVIPDLSWSYEQCFPVVHVVPLTERLELDAAGMLAKVEACCLADPRWPEHGALMVSNPHNATSRVFDPAALGELIAACLARGIYVIDDLAYQNVAPQDGLPEIATARQLAAEQVRRGRLRAADTARLISVHSMSKTDCLAGARLAVVEIPEAGLRARFAAHNARIRPNLMAIFLGYLFYRGPLAAARQYWTIRNRLFQARSQALLQAVADLPPDRNPFGLTIIPPAASMYPLLHIAKLPAGLSLDWLASSLARRGVGLLPLATFARTEQGFDTGRSTFRLTLGGADHAPALLGKTRRLLIDLNRIIAEEAARYNRRSLVFQRPADPGAGRAARAVAWEGLRRQIEHAAAQPSLESGFPNLGAPTYGSPAAAPRRAGEALRAEFLQTYLPERLEVFRTRFLERAELSDELVRRAGQPDGAEWLGERLDGEFMKDSLARRQTRFRLRNYDRTVHPTQRYALAAELALDALLAPLTAGQPPAAALVSAAAQELRDEFLGRNVSINSQQEAAEILLDFDALTAAESYTELFTATPLVPFLSFWSDWDGSSRPSGQGHHLVAAAVMENVRRMARVLTCLLAVEPNLPLDRDLLAEIQALPQQSRRFTQILQNITLLTHQLEGRYHSLLPVAVDASPLEQLATRLHLRRDQAKVLWQHNDRYEQKMRELRRQRRGMLEAYFALNKRLRKQLHALIPTIQAQREAEPLLREVVGYRDLLQRLVITPRVHQGMITARDPFAINTTVSNMQEINAIAGNYGNPGMTLALQISLSSQPEALIALDRKMVGQAEKVRRAVPGVELAPIWLIPLFEDIEAVDGIPAYLEGVWNYATQSRHTDQSPQGRFAEVFAEIFIAGSDLSQQISQAHGAFQYAQAKYRIQTWLAEHGVTEAVRVKLGSGEPMQRQGGYYSRVAGEAAFPAPEKHRRAFAAHLPAAAQRSTVYAVTPLQGIFQGGDLRTFQSSLSEELRTLPLTELANLLYHVRQAQTTHRANLVRAAETIAESRLGAQNRSVQELERLTIGANGGLYTGFLQELTRHFRHILYGQPEDVVGLHIIAYFIGRVLPQLRDRPTSRRRASAGADRGQQILANIAEIVPLAQQGSLLRAIAHNQAQTSVLGVNQLTTGLFRALDYYTQKTFPAAEAESLIAEHILPQLPVYEILHTLRLYQDCQGEYLRRMEAAFPAGNSAFVALREDEQARRRFLPLFQQELLRRHGLNVSDFLRDGVFIPELLPTLRPDLAVLLQADLFNTEPRRLLATGGPAPQAAWLAAVTGLLRQPEQIAAYRALIWEVIEPSITPRVQSFTELATALYAISTNRAFGSVPGGRPARLPSALAGFIRTAKAEDEMRQFLLGAVEYLSAFTEGSREVPVSIIRALNDVERLALIEESVLPAAAQATLRYALLQMARLAGDNG